LAGIVHDGADALAALLGVLDELSRDELVVELPQRQHEPALGARQSIAPAGLLLAWCEGMNWSDRPRPRDPYKRKR
jgi:hypothetical protein